MPNIAVVGTTSWGTTLAVVLARKALSVRLWARTEEEAVELTSNGSNHPILSQTEFPRQLSVTSSLDEALDGASAVILAVPSQRMRKNIRLVARHLNDSTLIVSAAKGMELGSGKRMSQVIADEVKASFRPNICVLSGPNLSEEILGELPAATVVASEDKVKARKLQKLLVTPKFCVYTNTDVIGVELGGTLKNIIAMGAGIADGLGYGDNAKAALVTRGLTEMTALGMALGANPLTFSGLAGLGDLIATCASTLSRNHFVGVELAKGRPLKEITESMTGVAEGVSTTLVVWTMAKKMGLAMPITETIYRVLYEDADIHEAAAELMTIEANHELAGRKWRLFSFLRQNTPSLPK
ncbi:MAG: NAD(P)H-dependent glycerol-3-phosphate dehydrogenase [Chloroflexota bacterium]